jgi:hypothetical protein
MAMLRAALLAGLVLAACCAAVSISGSEKPTVLEGPLALPSAAPEEPAETSQPEVLPAAAPEVLPAAAPVELPAATPEEPAAATAPEPASPEEPAAATAPEEPAAALAPVLPPSPIPPSPSPAPVPPSMLPPPAVPLPPPTPPAAALAPVLPPSPIPPSPSPAPVPPSMLPPPAAPLPPPAPVLPPPTQAQSVGFNPAMHPAAKIAVAQSGPTTAAVSASPVLVCRSRLAPICLVSTGHGRPAGLAAPAWDFGPG